MKSFFTNRSNQNEPVIRKFLFITNKILFIILFLICFSSCARNEEKSAEVSSLIKWSGAYPLAILQAGTNPLWFQLTEDGPVHIEAIEDAADIYAFAPWPYARHVRFIRETRDGIVMAVNRDGFLKLTPGQGRTPDISMYRFTSDALRTYSIGGFIFYDDLPAVVLYLDDIFQIQDLSPPKPRVWSFNMNSNTPFPITIPALNYFPEEEGWNIDSLRLADNGFYYYRAARRRGNDPGVKMFRSTNLEQEGVEISVDVFFNSIPRETVFSNPSLPPLPQGFAYTSTGRVGGILFASWEEQEDFSVAAAGFVLIKP